MGAHKPASHEHDRQADEQLLHLIAQKEKELEALVTAARTEAASIVSAARLEAEQIVAGAREQAVAEAREHEQRVAAEVARIERELLDRGTKDVETLRRQAAERLAAAVRLVVERVVKGSPE